MWLGFRAFLGVSGVTGSALRETSFINRSLAALADVLGALSERRGHIPYRNSQLTHFLQDVLGNVSPPPLGGPRPQDPQFVSRPLSPAPGRTHSRGGLAPPGHTSLGTSWLPRSLWSLPQCVQRVFSCYPAPGWLVCSGLASPPGWSSAPGRAASMSCVPPCWARHGCLGWGDAAEPTWAHGGVLGSLGPVLLLVPHAVCRCQKPRLSCPRGQDGGIRLQPVLRTATGGMF